MFQASFTFPTPLMSPNPHNNPATSVPCHLFSTLSTCLDMGTLWCSPSPATRSTLCQSTRSPPPMHCSPSIVPMQWMQDSIYPSPRSPSSARFKTHLNTQMLEGMAQCPGCTKPGLFLTRYPGQSLQRVPFLQETAG